MNKFAIASTKIGRTCNKIESVLIKKVIDLGLQFAEVDPEHCGLVSDTKFFTVVYNKFGRELGLCQDEVRELAKFLTKEDGNVSYEEFLKLVLPEGQDHVPLVTGLEWEDHQHVNTLTQFESRHLNVLITKIAHSCQSRGVKLEEYFEDYEKSSGNNGSMTIPHFRRILNVVGITFGPKELQLLLKRFMKNSYTINYVAFLDELKEITQWFDKHGFNDSKHEFLENYPGRVITVGVETLPRPEIGKINMAKTFGTNKACHPCVNQDKKRDIQLDELMLRIKKHIYDSRIRTREFFEKFDRLNRGFITKSQFQRGLDAIGLSSVHRLYIAQHDLLKILKAYEDPYDPDRMAWSKFCNDIDEVFTIRNLHQQPYRIVQSPPIKVKQLQRPGSDDWDSVSKTTQQIAQETLFRLRNFIKSRQIHIEMFFKGFDKRGNYHVTECQMRRVFSANSILLTEKEMQALISRYGDDMGFNYWKFMEEINDVQHCESKHKMIMELVKHVNEKQPFLLCSDPKLTIIGVLAKVKGQITRNRVNVDQFLCDGDYWNEGMVSECKFKSSFSAAGINLDECELEILCNACKVNRKPGFIDYKTFCSMINQAFYITKLEKRPCTTPIQHIPSSDDSLNLLDYEERHIVSHALQKLSRHHDDYSNMKAFFEDRTGRTGVITRDILKQVLTVCGGLMDLITQRELDVLYKCFSTAAGYGRKFDYKNFLMVLSRINAL